MRKTIGLLLLLSLFANLTANPTAAQRAARAARLIREALRRPVARRACRVPRDLTGTRGFLRTPTPNKFKISSRGRIPGAVERGSIPKSPVLKGPIPKVAVVGVVTTGLGIGFYLTDQVKKDLDSTFDDLRLGKDVGFRIRALGLLELRYLIDKAIDRMDDPEELLQFYEVLKAVSPKVDVSEPMVREKHVQSIITVFVNALAALFPQLDIPKFKRFFEKFPELERQEINKSLTELFGTDDPEKLLKVYNVLKVISSKIDVSVPMAQENHAQSTITVFENALVARFPQLDTPKFRRFFTKFPELEHRVKNKVLTELFGAAEGTQSYGTGQLYSIYNLVKYKDFLKQLKEVFRQEKVFSDGDKFVLYHGTSKRNELLTEIYTRLQEVKTGKRLDNFRFFRFYTDRGKKLGRSYGYKEGRDLLFCNASLLSNLQEESRECTTEFIQYDDSFRPPSITIEELFDALGLSKYFKRYKKDLYELEALNEKAGSGRLFQIALSKQQLKQTTYIARPFGREADLKTQSHGLLHSKKDVEKSFKILKDFPEEIIDDGFWMYCADLNDQVFTDPDQKLSVKVYHTADEEDWARYQSKLNEIFQKIKADKEREEAD